MKSREIRELTLQELDERIEAERDNLHNLRMSHSISPLENAMVLRESQKTIARMLTIRSERLRAQEETK